MSIGRVNTERKFRTESLLQGVAYFHSISIDRGTVLTNEHLGNFRYGLGGTGILRCPAHRHVCVWWLGLVSVVGWDYCLGGIVSRITSTERRRTDVDDESSDFIWISQLVLILGCARLDMMCAPPPYWTMTIVRGFTRVAIGQSLWTTSANNLSLRSLVNFLRIQMASVLNPKKRKVSAPDPTPGDDQLPSANALEMLSEDEQDEEPESDDGDYEEFPEIDAASDTDEDEDEETEGEEEEEEDYSSDASGSDKKLPIFPKAKVVISEITGEPKKVYPEIEPDYDSDSSTEDVSTSPVFASTNALRCLPYAGP